MIREKDDYRRGITEKSGKNVGVIAWEDRAGNRGFLERRLSGFRTIPTST